MGYTTWRKEIIHAMQINKDTWDNIIACTLTDSDLNMSFDNGYGAIEGKPFTVWTKHYVYFPACYDGAEWVGSVPRDPNEEPTEHIGGG